MILVILPCTSGPLTSSIPFLYFGELELVPSPPPTSSTCLHGVPASTEKMYFTVRPIIVPVKDIRIERKKKSEVGVTLNTRSFPINPCPRNLPQ